MAKSAEKNVWTEVVALAESQASGAINLAEKDAKAIQELERRNSSFASDSR